MEPPTNKGTVGNSIYTFKKRSKIDSPLVSVNSWVACMAPCMCTTCTLVCLMGPWQWEHVGGSFCPTLPEAIQSQQNTQMFISTINWF